MTFLNASCPSGFTEIAFSAVVSKGVDYLGASWYNKLGGYGEERKG